MRRRTLEADLILRQVLDLYGPFSEEDQADILNVMCSDEFEAFLDS